MENKSVLRWTLRTIKPWIPALILLVLTNIANALLVVWFSLGTKDVIDGATSGNKAEFYNACIVQGVLILVMILNGVLSHHLFHRLSAVIDRDLKKKMLTGLLRGDYAKVSAYHSGDLLTRVAGDVSAISSSVLPRKPM